MKKLKRKKRLSLRDNQTRVCLWIDDEILEKIRRLAEEDKMKYQPWLNQFLRLAVKDFADSIR